MKKKYKHECIVCGKTYYSIFKDEFIEVCNKRECKKKVKVCPTCNRIFVAKDERQIYCKETCMEGVMSFEELNSTIDFTSGCHLCLHSDGSPNFRKEIFELKMNKIQLGIANNLDELVARHNFRTNGYRYGVRKEM